MKHLTLLLFQAVKPCYRTRRVASGGTNRAKGLPQNIHDKQSIFNEPRGGTFHVCGFAVTTNFRHRGRVL